MRFSQFVKTLARSRSLRFTMASAPGNRSAALARLRWQGRDVCYRPGTSDPLVLGQVLLRKGEKAEYYVPPALRPEVILDIGSNIGASILYFHHQFPNARIFGFEPHPETFRILKANVADIPAVSVFNYALGERDMAVTIPSNETSFSAFSLRRRFPNSRHLTAQVDCQLRHAGEALKELGLEKVDLMKIDCEGGEFEIFSALPDKMLGQCKWIVGEIHDAAGFRALALLSSSFNLDLKKDMFNPFFRFHACNLVNSAELKGSFNDKALQV